MLRRLESIMGASLRIVVAGRCGVCAPARCDRLRGRGRAVELVKPQVIGACKGRLEMIVKNSADDLGRLLGLGRIGVAMPHQGDQGLPDRPIPCTFPRRRIEPNRGMEYPTAR